MELHEKNCVKIKEAYYTVGWHMDVAPSGFDNYCDDVFYKVTK